MSTSKCSRLEGRVAVRQQPGGGDIGKFLVGRWRISREGAEQSREGGWFPDPEPMVHLGHGLSGFGGRFGETAGHHEDRVRVLPPESAGQRTGIPVGPAGDGAAVDDQDVGGGPALHDLEPGARRMGEYRRGVGEVRLAADGYDREATAHSIQPPPRTSSPS